MTYGIILKYDECLIIYARKLRRFRGFGILKFFYDFWICFGFVFVFWLVFEFIFGGEVFFVFLVVVGELFLSFVLVGSRRCVLRVCRFCSLRSVLFV